VNLDIDGWLRRMGLDQYAQTFRENGIDLSVLPDLTDQDLEKLGVLVGHRRKLLRAIADLEAVEKGAPAVAVAAASPLASRPLDTAERRQLTVMFCDLVGSTAMSARLDPEDMREIIGAYHRCCADRIIKAGGFLAKYMGDGVLAYFGYPQADEHDAERAVRAGLTLVEAVSKLATPAGDPLQVRVGIATGLVVVGDIIGTGSAQEQAVVGETPNLAARLQSLAEPGAVVLSSSTRMLTGGLFDYRDLGAVALKGFAENAHVWQALGASATESRFEALRGSTTPLVGRNEEIDLLLRRWEQAKGGDGCVVLVTGEPGIGKSRIVQALLDRLSGEPHTRLCYFCSPHHQDSTLYPSITQLERAAALRRDDADEQRLSKLEGVLAQATDDLSEAVPLLADLLSIPTGDQYPALNLTPHKRKEKTLRALLAQVEGLASRQPVMMMFEDVHWSDPTTLESLELLIDRVPSLRVLVIVTFRPEFIPSWVGRPQVTLLSLSRLSPRQRAELIMHVTGGKLLPQEIVDQITNRTDGVPLFVEELTKAVVESGLLMDGGDRYVAAGPITQMAIPTSLQASLLARLDRLAPTRDVAQIAAAIGRQFSHELISAVAAMPQQQLDDALAQLVHAELILRRGAPPDAEYTFKHALVQDAAYSTLLRSRRQQLHSIIANVLETRFAETSKRQPGILAHHFTEAGIIERAIDCWTEAGRQARRRSAMAEAEATLRKGLTLVSSLPDTVWRQEHELDLRIDLGRTLYATQGYGATPVGEAYARSRQLCDQLNRPQQLFAALTGQWTHHQLRAELDRAQQLAAELRQLGDRLNDVSARSVACRVSGYTDLFLGGFVASRVYLQRSLALCNSAEPRRSGDLTSVEMLNAILGPLSWASACGGHLDQAQSSCDAALVAARRVSHAHTLAIALWWAWGVGWFTRSWPSGLLLYADELLGLATEGGFPYWRALALVARGWCLAAMGDGDQGIPLLTTGLADLNVTESGQFMPGVLTILADAHRICGQPQLGLARLADAERLAGATSEGLIAAETLRMKGDLLILTDNRIAAEASFRDAVALARRQEAKLWELRASTSLARLWRDQGKPQQARELLAPVYSWFTEGFDTLDLKAAKALLGELAA
jgi:class 3 adenylate cyclase